MLKTNVLSYENLLEIKKLQKKTFFPSPAS